MGWQRCAPVTDPFSPLIRNEDMPYENPMSGVNTVFYDGSCPVCSREIAMYRYRSEKGAFRWIDVSQADSEHLIPAGLTKSELLNRFHVLKASGIMVSGAEAFATIWQRSRGFRWLAAIARTPGALWLMERTYRVFLLIRRTR